MGDVNQPRLARDRIVRLGFISLTQPRDVRLYLEDIRERAAKVLRYTDGMSRKEFFSDEKTYDAVLRNLEIVGEAAKHVPADRDFGQRGRRVNTLKLRKKSIRMNRSRKVA